MEKMIRDIDSLILDIYQDQDINLEKEKREEADRVVEYIISLYSGIPSEPERTSWWLNNKNDILILPEEPKKKYWWLKTKKTILNKNKNNLRILT